MKAFLDFKFCDLIDHSMLLIDSLFPSISPLQCRALTNLFHSLQTVLTILGKQRIGHLVFSTQVLPIEHLRALIAIC